MPNSDTDGDAYRYCNGDSHSDSHIYSYAHSNSDRDTGAKTYTDSKASADAGTASVAFGSKRAALLTLINCLDSFDALRVQGVYAPPQAG